MTDLTSRGNDRSLHRHQIEGVVDVYDGLRDIYVGRVVNIHSQGLMLVGDLLLNEDCLYAFDLHLPDKEDKKNILRVGVDCLWTRPADQNGMHWSGFSIIDLTPRTFEEIQKLIQSWGI